MAEPKPTPMTLDELANIGAEIKDRFAKQDALVEQVAELGQAMADILSLLRKQGPENAAAIATALKGIKLDGASVNVTVPEIKIPAPQVVVNQRDKKLSLSIEVEPSVNGSAKRYTIKET